MILEVEQPFANHNGGQIAFGPDGYLYIGLGDGGSAGDPLGSGQDTSTLLGAILRIDVSQSGQEHLYAIPPDNPFASGGGRAEIWAYGLRNPWRFSFDRDTGDLWAGDVGQNRWEEIDLIERGGNYGWNLLEGNHCFSARDCDPTGTVPPVWEYSLDGQPCSVIGGYVYRGSTRFRGYRGSTCTATSAPARYSGCGTRAAGWSSTSGWPTRACASCRSPRTTAASCICSRRNRASIAWPTSGRARQETWGRTSSVKRAIWPIWSGEANLTMK